jgi:hypothetical protein
LKTLYGIIFCLAGIYALVNLDNPENKKDPAIKSLLSMGIACGALFTLYYLITHYISVSASLVYLFVGSLLYLLIGAIATKIMRFLWLHAETQANQRVWPEAKTLYVAAFWPITFPITLMICPALILIRVLFL